MPTSASLLEALDQRLRAVAPHLLEEVPPPTGVPTIDGVQVLEALVDRLRARTDSADVWLVVAALTAQLPTSDLVRMVRRRLGLLAKRDVVIWLLNLAASTMGTSDADTEIEVITDRPIVDVDFSARSDLLTGIQRVVRQLVPRWDGDHEIELVRWDDSKAFTALSEEERGRVRASSGRAADGSGDRRRRIIPWGAPVLLLEVPFMEEGRRLAGLAEFSPSPVGIIGYDCIPVVSAELVTEKDREKFAEYLELVKYVDVVAGISTSAAAEFAGFVSALPAQGIDGPRIVTCGLPTTVKVASDRASVELPLPEVLCVGTVDRRKNQIVLVEAAEHLWRAGERFRLRLIGPISGQDDESRLLIESLVEAGRPLSVDKEVSDADLDAAYRSARMVVFPTRHEGFGLPVAEALSYGVPVVTSDFGSTREIAEGNGAILVDPVDVGAVMSAIRALLTDDELHARLVHEARSRDTRSWDDYAAELWQVLVP
ncbi:glycosyltransferase [Nocardioides sp. L-11A]|uniref:glycosyltransferase n=1 Tax=Nocardioides sp. L-11A TaxID=3043848 RepID=UPI00249B52DF|nr:glycosyltransferase [Nocardioides sp. L-11A]